MRLFFDTSAVVPLLLREVHTDEAMRAWTQATQAWAWEWLQVETVSALTRREANARIWGSWRELSGEFEWAGLGDHELPALCDFTRGTGLRAADAGHLFLCERLQKLIPDLALVTFDQAMKDAAETLDLPTWIA